MESNCHHRKILPGVLILSLGLVLHIIGLSSNYWTRISATGTHMGLWKVCTIDMNGFEACFTINQRGSVPTVVFISSFLNTISVLIGGFACITAILTLCQKTKHILKWCRYSTTAALLNVALSVCVECVYGASFRSITYENIPHWKTSSRADTLGWSFFVSCTSTGIILLGSIYLIVVPASLVASNKVAEGIPQIPVLQIHPPPSDRTPTPLFLLSQRSSSPLPSPFSGKPGRQHTQSLPPVFTQLRK